MVNERGCDLFTVITGASKGLGKCFAIECAKEGRNLILVALAGESVVETAQEISKEFSVKVTSYETDLTRLENIHSLADWIKANYKVNMLINNAGMGGTQHFDEATTGYIDTMIQLNVTALVHLTHQLLPLLKAENKSYVLNIASLAAFGPMPYKTVYPASKAFVSSFSKGLNEELKGTTVSVSVAYPGGMATSPEIAARMDRHPPIFRATFLSTERIAEICLEKTFLRKPIIVPGVGNKINRFFIKLIPEKWVLRILSKSVKREMLEKIG